MERGSEFKLSFSEYLREKVKGMFEEPNILLKTSKLCFTAAIFFFLFTALSYFVTGPILVTIVLFLITSTLLGISVVLKLVDYVRKDYLEWKTKKLREK